MPGTSNKECLSPLLPSIDMEDGYIDTLARFGKRKGGCNEILRDFNKPEFAMENCCVEQKKELSEEEEWE